MRSLTPKKTSLFFPVLPLVIYEVTFILFVIYYIQKERVWFLLACLSIVVSVLTSITRAILAYKKWSALTGKDKNSYSILVLMRLLFLSLYIFCLLVFFDQWKVLGSPFVVIYLLATPPLISFILFLYSNTKNPTV